MIFISIGKYFKHALITYKMQDQLICIRTDYTNDDIWQRIKYDVAHNGNIDPDDEFLYYINDRKYDGVDIKDIDIINAPQHIPLSYYVIADSDTMRTNMFKVVEKDSGKYFMCSSKMLWSPVINIVLGISSFNDYLNWVDDDNILHITI